MRLTIRTFQPKVPPLHRLLLGNPASAIRIQGTAFATNRLRNATQTGYVGIEIEQGSGLGNPVQSWTQCLPSARLCTSFTPMNELIFEVTQEGDGGFVAEALGESIFTQADNWDELRANVREAVTAFYFDRPAPARVRLHLVRDEVLA